MLNIELPYDPAVPLLGMYPREIKTCPHKNLHVKVRSNVIHNSEKVQTTQCSSTATWINKIWHIHRGGFPVGSDGKESAYKAGDLGLIPGSGRSPGEGNGNPL